MGKTLYALLPDTNTLLSLEPEELAGFVLEVLNSLESRDSGIMHRGNFISGLTNYPAEKRESIGLAITEAWSWLEREGFISPKPQGGEHGWFFVTRRGQRLKGTTDLSSYLKASMLPKKMLHPVLVQKISSLFIRGDYDTAVFQAFKEVEVAVRDAAKLELTDIGVDLMRTAFSTESGPLTDTSIPKGEREAMSHLFAGSIGLFKNPHSHRNQTITDPMEAIEVIFLASHLLRIVDLRMGIQTTEANCS